MFLTKKFKIIFSSLLFILSFLIVAQTGLAITSATVGADTGLDKTAAGGYGTLPKDTNLSSIIGKIVGTALAFLGVIFFVLIIMGGYMWMTSMGNEQSTTKAKDILLAAVIGLFIVLIAYAATMLISGIFTS